MRLLTCLIVAVASLPSRAFEPTAHYDQRTLEGWTLYVNKALLSDKPLAEKSLELLRAKLIEVKHLIPSPALETLQEVPIWFELSDPKSPGACYHPSVGWLKANDYNPEKAKCVQISNAKNFLAWSKSQPAMMLHELAHAYHHRVLGHGNAEIKTAYKAAVASKSYESVLHISGKTQKHYALNNEQEYFAEATESFFATNDFYPFVRAELKAHDPAIFATLQKLWHSPQAAPKAAPAAELLKTKESSVR